jgi:hypothetical protein
MCATVLNFFFLLQVEQEFTVWFESTLLEGPKTIHVIEVQHSAVFSLHKSKCSVLAFLVASVHMGMLTPLLPEHPPHQQMLYCKRELQTTTATTGTSITAVEK